MRVTRWTRLGNPYLTIQDTPFQYSSLTSSTGSHYSSLHFLTQVGTGLFICHSLLLFLLAAASHSQSPVTSHFVTTLSTRFSAKRRPLTLHWYNKRATPFLLLHLRICTAASARATFAANQSTTFETTKTKDHIWDSTLIDETHLHIILMPEKRITLVQQKASNYSG